LKELSKDNQGNYLTETISMAYNYDSIAGDSYKSCDALLINNNKVVFIEFKNQPANRRNQLNERELKCDLKLKAIESLLALFNLLKSNNITDKFSDMFKISKILIVVYSSDKTKLNYSFRDRLDNNSEIKFDLKKYKGTLYNNVITWANDIFELNIGKLN